MTVCHDHQLGFFQRLRKRETGNEVEFLLWNLSVLASEPVGLFCRLPFHMTDFYCLYHFRCGLKTEEPSVVSWTKPLKTNENSRRNPRQEQFLLRKLSKRNQVLRRTNFPAAVQTWITCGTARHRLHWHTVKISPPLPCWETIPVRCSCLPHTLPLRLHLRRIIDQTLTVRTCRHLTCIWTDLASRRIRQHICNDQQETSVYILLAI